MIIYTICKSCKQEIKVKTGAVTRPDLETEQGAVVSQNCSNCGNMQDVHVNDIKARENQTIIIFGVLVGLLFTGLLWFALGAIAAISLSIPYMVKQSQANSVYGFNSYKVIRKVDS